MLLDYGADPTALHQGSHRFKPLDWTVFHLAAAEGTNQGVFMAVSKLYENVNIPDALGQTPLHLIWGNRHLPTSNMARYLLDRRADVNYKDQSGCIPLHCAVASGHQDISDIQLLLDRDGNKSINFKDKDGRTPLSLAVESEREAIVKLLLEKGVDPDSKDSDGRTPLSFALDKDRAVVKLLESNTQSK